MDLKEIDEKIAKLIPLKVDCKNYENVERVLKVEVSIILVSQN
jgi:hypothetical protein